MATGDSEWREGDSQKSWEGAQHQTDRIRQMADKERLTTLRGKRNEIIRKALEDAWLYIEKKEYRGQLGLFEWEIRDENGFSINVFFYYFEGRGESRIPLSRELKEVVVGKLTLAYSSLKLGVIFDENCGVGASPEQASDVVDKMEEGKRPTNRILVPKTKKKYGRK